MSQLLSLVLAGYDGSRRVRGNSIVLAKYTTSRPFAGSGRDQIRGNPLRVTAGRHGDEGSSQQPNLI